MTTIFFRKNQQRIKKGMLRGVYEENLKIVGKGGVHLARTHHFFLKKMILIFLIAITTVLLHGIFFDNTFLAEKELTASLISQNMPARPDTSSANVLPATSDYQVLINNRGAPLSRMFGLGVKTIMIDAGHGGSDSGAIGKMGTQEKNITLDIARRLKERLLKSGHYKVLMTREDDVAVPLNKRVEIARAAKADLFISVHLNYLPTKPINMIETYYFGPSADAKDKKLAEKENAGSEYVLSDFKEMIEKLGETMKLEESREFATSIQRSLFVNSRKQNGNVHDFGVKRAPFVVLLGVDVPAVLAEVSCLSNSQEEEELNTVTHRENIARYLDAGIMDYLNKGDLNYDAKR